MSSQLHVKNHFVPEFYLKHWTGGTAKLQVYKLLVPHENMHLWKAQSPAAIGWQKHLYTEITAGKENDELEHWFSSEYESPAQPIIQKVINNQKLTPSDWKILIRFLALQDFRTPASMLRFLELEREHLDKIQRFRAMPGLSTHFSNSDSVASPHSRSIDRFMF